MMLNNNVKALAGQDLASGSGLSVPQLNQSKFRIKEMTTLGPPLRSLHQEVTLRSIVVALLSFHQKYHSFTTRWCSRIPTCAASLKIFCSSYCIYTFTSDHLKIFWVLSGTITVLNVYVTVTRLVRVFWKCLASRPPRSLY